MSKAVAYSFAAIALALSWDNSHTPGQDGLFLQPEEATKVNNSLAAGQKAITDLVTANETAEQLKTENTGLKTEAQTSATKITELSNTITSLEKQVKELGGKPSGSGSTLTTTEDPKREEGNVVSLLDPNHPLNTYAKGKIAASKKFKKK